MTHYKRLLCAACVVFCAACSGRQDAAQDATQAGESSLVTAEPLDAKSNRTPYNEIIAGVDADLVAFPLCTLVRHPMYESGGLYVVDALTGYTEPMPGRSGARTGATYAELSLVEDWFASKSKIRVRLSGGPLADGQHLMWRVGLKVGETVGLLVVKPFAENNGFSSINELGLFRARPSGGYTNGQLFTDVAVSAAELGRMVRGLRGPAIGEQCPYDVVPSGQSPSGHKQRAPTEGPFVDRDVADPDLKH